MEFNDSMQELQVSAQKAQEFFNQAVVGLIAANCAFSKITKIIGTFPPSLLDGVMLPIYQERLERATAASMESLSKAGEILMAALENFDGGDLDE